MAEKYMEAINDCEVVIISIVARQDVLNEEIIELLKELIKIKPIWIEPGLQAIHESTALLYLKSETMPRLKTCL